MKISKNLKKLNILFVEDDKLVNETLSFIFKKYVKTIFNAYNGEEGLKIFKNNHIDIVISDIQMPKMNGIEMAKEIRKINENIPIIFTTAFEESKYLKESIELGVDAYILKPIDKEQLLKKLNKIADNLVLKQEVENYTKLMKIVFDYQTDALILLDENYDVVIYNKAAGKILENNEKNLEFLKKEIDKILKENRFTKIETIVSFHNKRFYKLNIKKIDHYILINCIDITDLKIKIDKIEDGALKDELTGAYNRKKIDKILKDLKNKSVCIIIFDIDNFKKINDTYGHLKGDEVLKKLSDNIQNNIRERDLFIRWGGEEFIVLLRNASTHEAEKLAEKLRKIVNSIEIEEVGHFSCSFGVACGIVEKEMDFDKIFKNADDALYLAKKNGKNRVEIYGK
jgi:two-component system cell cycle response regulator